MSLKSIDLIGLVLFLCQSMLSTSKILITYVINKQLTHFWLELTLGQLFHTLFSFSWGIQSVRKITISTTNRIIYVPYHSAPLHLSPNFPILFKKKEKRKKALPLFLN
jgi:hypothetical protein